MSGRRKMVRQPNASEVRGFLHVDVSITLREKTMTVHSIDPMPEKRPRLSFAAKFDPRSARMQLNPSSP
jgi:hypothetical protein